MSERMIQLPKAPKMGNTKTAKSPLLHRLIADLSPSKRAVKKLYVELKRRSSDRRHELHTKSVILQNMETNRESTTFKLSSSIDIGTERKVVAINESPTKASKIGFNNAISANKIDGVALHSDGTSKNIYNDYNPNNSIASVATNSSKMFMATPYHSFNLIASGQIDYNVFGSIEYSIYGYYDQGYSINLVAGASEEPWALFIPGSTYSSELNVLWGRMNNKKETVHKTKLAQWMLNCTTLEFANSIYTIKSTSFDHKLFVNYQMHEITMILDKCSRVLTEAMRKYCVENRRRRLLIMKQAADAGRHAAVQRIKAYNGYKVDKSNNFSAKYDNIMRSTQNMKHWYKTVDGAVKATKDRAIHDEAKGYAPEKNEFNTSLADYALDWIDDYKNLGDAFHINGESKELSFPESSRDSIATGDAQQDAVDSDEYEHHNNSINIYNTKPVISSEWDPYGLFTPTVLHKKQPSSSASVNSFDPAEIVDYELTEIEVEEEAEEEEEGNLDLSNAESKQIASGKQHNVVPMDVVSNAVVVVQETEEKGGFFTSISSFFFGTNSCKLDAKPLGAVTAAVINNPVIVNETSVTTLVALISANPTDPDIENVTVITELNTGHSPTNTEDAVAVTPQDEFTIEYEKMVGRKGDDWASSLFKSTV